LHAKGKSVKSHRPEYAAVIALIVLSHVHLAGCSKDLVQIDPGDRLCGGRGGFGALIAGAADTVEMCLPDDNTVGSTDVGVQTTYDRVSRSYLVHTTYVSDSLTHQFHIGFRVQSSPPTALSLTEDSIQAFADVHGVWFFYREIKAGAYEFVSDAVSGTFNLTFSDSCIATARFGDLTIDLENAATNAPAGMRKISDGFLSVTRDNPADCP
jgi:hypothetical protein